MKHLKRYNENINHKPVTLQEFLLDLNKEVSQDGFSVTIHQGQCDHINIEEVYDFDDYLINIRDSYISIDKDGGTFIDFAMDDFSIEDLKWECDRQLKSDKSKWPSTVSDDTKDDYDQLCTSILTFLDMKGYDKIIITKKSIEEAKEWWEVIRILDIDDEPDRLKRNIKRLMSKFNISRK